jgi:hypothetical protein
MNRIITQTNKKVETPDSFEKGRLFENYIIELFNKKHFGLVAWRMAQKGIDNSLLIDYSKPDLELIFEGKKKYRFAIECKWRQEFRSGKIEWASQNQIRTYKNFEKRYRIEVFVAVGIGGDPSNPEKLFVTPLCNISKYTEVYESDLLHYERKPTRRFFYDTVQLKLF